MPQHPAGGKTQFLLCAPAPPSYTEQFPTTLQLVPHQTPPEGSDVLGHPQALHLSAPDSSHGKDAQGQRRGLRQRDRPAAAPERAGTLHRPQTSRHSPEDAQPDPRRRLQRR